MDVAVAQDKSSVSTPLAVYTDWDEFDVEPAVRRLRAAGWRVALVGSRDPDVIARAAADAAVLCLGFATVDAALLDRLPALRLIALLSAGTDMVDVDAAHARGVWVANLPDLATDEVASHALAMALALARRLPDGDREVASGRWALPVEEPPRSLASATLGIIGLGRIGRRLAALAAPCFGEVIGNDPPIADEQWPPDVTRSEFDELLRAADVISLHCAPLPGGRPLLDRDALARMRPGAIVVNVSRGSLIDDEALLDALDEGRLRAAGLDVLANEPPPRGHPLVGHARVLCSAHVAFLSELTLAGYPMAQAENVLHWAGEGRPVTPVGEIG